uniref:Putative ovule protein n=1 Tax=Solanum chacoense TaxID=4108 RepID=A0A0V0GVE3_SOLCH
MNSQSTCQFSDHVNHHHYINLNTQTLMAYSSKNDNLVRMEPKSTTALTESQPINTTLRNK